MLYSVQTWSLRGNTGYQLGVKFLNGNAIAHFVANSVTARQTNLSEDVTTPGTTLTADFPLDHLSGLGNTFHWSATLNIAGNDVDTCPSPGNDPLHPKQEVFPNHTASARR